MWPYFVFLSVILLLQFRLGRYNDNRIRYFWAISIIFFFAAFRGNGDGDYFVYLSRGEDINSIYDVFNNHIGMELGYCILAYIINIFKLPKQCILITMNLISIFCLNKFIKKYSLNWCLSILVLLPLYFQFDMHAARTAVAISITTVSIKYALDKKKILFTCTVLLAMLFHNTAVIAFGLYFLPGISINRLIGSFGILLSIVMGKIIGIDQLILKILSAFGLESFYQRISIYINSEQYGYEFSLLDPRLLLAIITYYLSKIIIKNPTKIENMIINCSFVNAVILILFSQHTFIAYRLAAFYNIYMIIALPMLMNAILKNKGRIRISFESRRGLNFLSLSFFGLYAIAFIITCFLKTGIIYKFFFIN